MLTAARFADKETWKKLQGYQAAARLQLDGLLTTWRAEAKQRLQDAIDRLPDDLAQRALDAGLAARLLKPLSELRDSLDTVTAPATVANLTQRADQAVRELGRQLMDATAENEKPEASAPPESTAEAAAVSTAPRRKPAKPAQPVAGLRVVDVALVTRFATVAEWEKWAAELDRRVRELLAKGQVVELL